MQKGFTLVEVMVAVSVLVVIALGGSLVLFKTLSSRGQNQSQINVNQAGDQAIGAMENSLRFATVSSVGSFTRTNCLSSPTGVSGTTLLATDPFGNTTYGLSENRIASISGTIVYLSSPDVTASSIQFTWFCVSGSYDKMRVKFTMSDGTQTRNFTRDINMYNSGI